MKNRFGVCSTIGAALSMAALLSCPAILANPVEIDTDWTFEMTDSDTAVVFEFTSFGEEGNEEVMVEWKDGDDWVRLPVETWEKSGTVTASGSGETWEMDRVARTIPCPGEGDWSYRLAVDPGPEYQMRYPISETAHCSAAGENADEYYDIDDPVDSCSASPRPGRSGGLIALIEMVF